MKKFERSALLREWAIFLKRKCILLGLVFAIGALYGIYINNDQSNYFSIDYWLPEGMVAIAIYLIAALMFYVIKLISDILYHFVFFEEDTESGVFLSLHSMNMPKPTKYRYRYGTAYYYDLANDEEADVSDRLKATKFVTALRVGQLNGSQLWRHVHERAADRAVNRYLEENRS